MAKGFNHAIQLAISAPRGQESCSDYTDEQIAHAISSRPSTTFPHLRHVERYHSEGLFSRMTGMRAVYSASLQAGFTVRPGFFEGPNGLLRMFDPKDRH